MWAQNQNQDVGGKWSWHDARDYFYKGLTATGKAARDSFFAKTFRALGQLMHLVQDASVPSHTRNDIHAVYHYESWVEDVRKKWSVKYNSWISTPKTYDRSILDLAPNPLAPIPIAKIMDTDKYTKDNQDIESTKSLAIGIAEYSNGNFFSEDTCFAGWYPFPNWACVESVSYQIVDPRDPLRTVSRQYYKKDATVVCGETNEGKGYRLATVGFLKDYVLKYFPTWVTFLRAFEKNALDSNVYGDYASLLMPRAVGYSAGLLEYFFRGAIEITLPLKGVYAQTENRGQGFTRVTLLARNTTPEDEEMTNGSIELVVKYKKTLDNQDPFQSYPVPTEDNFSYIVAPILDANIRSIPRNQLIELVFDLSQNPIPVNITDLSLQVVYKGRLEKDGRVEGEAVAVGFKDISEPTPIDLYNDMDRICINGSWYMAGSSEALSLGNQFNFDAYPHNLRNIYLRYSPANNPQEASSTDFNLHIPSLDAGDFFIRQAFILSDYQFNYGYRVTIVNADLNDPYVSWFEPEVISYKGMKNQTAPGTPEQCAALNVGYPCNVRYFPDHFYSFREQQIWEWIVFQNSPYPSSSSCPLE
jgi:hypothetical protein